MSQAYEGSHPARAAHGLAALAPPLTIASPLQICPSSIDIVSVWWHCVCMCVYVCTMSGAPMWGISVWVRYQFGVQSIRVHLSVALFHKEGFDKLMRGGIASQGPHASHVPSIDS
eukprot:743168-Pelagomonas_calceolata.AAC.3